MKGRSASAQAFDRLHTEGDPAATQPCQKNLSQCEKRPPLPQEFNHKLLLNELELLNSAKSSTREKDIIGHNIK